MKHPRYRTPDAKNSPSTTTGRHKKVKSMTTLDGPPPVVADEISPPDPEFIQDFVSSDYFTNCLAKYRDGGYDFSNYQDKVQASFVAAADNTSKESVQDTIVPHSNNSIAQYDDSDDFPDFDSNDPITQYDNCEEGKLAPSKAKNKRGMPPLARQLLPEFALCALAVETKKKKHAQHKIERSAQGRQLPSKDDTTLL